ncbi:hypothetical protein CU666_05375 [Pseudomonas syringae pv. actinidifoliorum]|nr:hypothetical protein [Pseudomonas syringae pv. actinidifoliorum]
MNLFQRLKGHASQEPAKLENISSATSTIEPEQVDVEQPDDVMVEGLKASDQNDVDAALERYLKRLEDQGIPAPGDWRNPKQKPATVGDVARYTTSNRALSTYFLGSSTCHLSKRCF